MPIQFDPAGLLWIWLAFIAATFAVYVVIVGVLRNNMALQLDPEDYEALGFAAHSTLTFHEIEATRLSIDKQYKPSKEQVALYNRRYYLKRKAAQPPKPKKVPLTLSEMNRRYYLKHKEKILARRKMQRGLRAAVKPKKGAKDAL